MMHINCYMIKYKVIYDLLNVITAYSIDLTNKQQDMVSTDVKHRPRIWFIVIYILYTMRPEGTRLGNDHLT